jgi:hypothetical protein
MKELTERAKRRVAIKEADLFWAKCKTFLLRQSTDKTRDGLEEIMKTAVGLSFRLWTQRSYLIREGRNLLGNLFDKKTKIWMASGLHTAELEEDEDCMNGKPILFIFHPAVILYGDSEGTDYSTRRILKKAVVWMG